MKAHRASRTAEGIAAVRAVESLRPVGERLFEDPFARGFLGRRYGALALLARIPSFRNLLVRLYEQRLPGTVAYAVCRTRYIDDVLTEAVRAGAEQVVILGAGFDSRAYRMAALARTRVFEVDHPATQAAKRARLARMLPVVPPHVTFVPIDFEKEKLEIALLRAGYRAGARTFFIWEGVVSYLTAEAVAETLRFVADSSGPESRIVFTYLHRGILDGTARFEGAGSLIAYVRRQKEPFSFGFYPDRLAADLAERGFDLLEDLGAAEWRARYPATFEALDVKITGFTHVALARVRA